MTYYIGIAVRKSGHGAVTKPCKNMTEVLTELKKYSEKHFTDMAFTTYITRTSDKEDYTLADVFGHPKSRDMIQDKNFLRSITK